MNERFELRQVDGAPADQRVIGIVGDEKSVVAGVPFGTDAEKRRAELLVRTPALCAALLKLYQVCEAMDAENQDERPTEDEYQAAMRDAAAVLLAAEVLE